MQVILFDVDGVLIHGYHARPELRVCWDENLERDFGINRDRFKSEFIFGEFINKVIIGKKDLKESLSRILPDLGFYGDPQLVIDYWLKNDSNINLELLEKIKILKNSGKARLFIATNQEHNRARYLMDKLGFAEYFEDIFYSGRIGCLKPAKEYFEYIAASLKLSANETPIFFDDTPEVIAGAKSFGWEAIEFMDTKSLNKNPFINAILNAN